jgi:hypothetical protein
MINVFFDGTQRDATATGTVSGIGIAFIQRLHSGTVIVTKE